MALARAVGKSCESAVTATVEPSGGVSGAAYTPAAEIVPNVVLPPSIPLTSQSTFVVDAPVTVAENAFVFRIPAVRVQEVGVIVTCGGGRIVVAEVADTFESSNETAVTLTVEGEGTAAGAR